MSKNSVSQHDIARIAAKVGAAAGVKAYEERAMQAKEERVDRRLRNTRLLLRKYRVFKLHCDNAVYLEQDDEDISVYEILEELDGFGESMYVESIQRSVRRTRIIIRHIDTMLDMYHIYCSRSKRPEDMRHYRVIMALYIDDKELTVEEIAELEGIHERTVDKDRDKAVEILSGLFFGIDSMSML